MPNRMHEDLSRSGLAVDDVNARPISSPERAATNTPHTVAGYVLPYLSLQGSPVPFYRVRLFDHEPKYKQPRDAANHVYYPKGFLAAAQKSKYVIITEGEKKAALATRRGFPAVALGGVDSWRNRIISLPADAELSSSSNKVQARLPAGGEAHEDYMSPLALGLQDLIDYVIRTDKTLIIVFDSDTSMKTYTQVQHAAASLGFELRFRGIPFERIRQIILPAAELGAEKIGLDDYLMHAPETHFPKLVANCLAKPSAFPRHPNIRDFINKRLQKAKLSRKETQQIANAILSELDATGLRLRNKDEIQSYYFDRQTLKLMRVRFSGSPDELSENPFGQYLYRTFGLGAADQRVVQWLGSQFNGEAPVLDVTPYRVFARPDHVTDNVIMQISDGAYIVVDANGLHIKANGTDSILFESEQVRGIDVEKLKAEWTRQAALDYTPNWWMDVLNDVRLRDKDKQRAITALLFYVSPWLYRWRGTQLPVEMTLGEAGSGKSTLQELRLMIQTGDPRLRNAPQDMKDWTASAVNAGGMHITDNVQLLDKQLRQRLSDELCRIVTEPYPHVEMRKYYTNADLMRLPVRCVFGITAIQQPFLNADILQRSVIIELDKAQDIVNGSLSYDMAWKEQQLTRFGGREAWLAHHLLVLHRFFKLVQQKWNRKYSAKHRLINFEQSMMLMAEVFNLPNEWIPDYLMGATNAAVVSTDMAYEGLIAFSEYWRVAAIDPVTKKPKHFTVQDIGNWAMGNDDYEKCEILVNTRKLGRYMKTHQTMVATGANIVEAGMANNRVRYRLAK